MGASRRLLCSRAGPWSTNYYHTSVSAGADVARAREITIGRIPVNLNANLSANLDARADLGWALPMYTFATPVFGGQATVGVLGLYGRVSTSLAGTLSGTLATPLGTIPFSRSDSISDAVWGFGDLIPIATLRWNAGVHNYMTYITGDVPVGAYDSTRLSNLGIGHGAIDAGGGYTYFNPQTGHEFSGVLGFTYNFENQSTQYQNGVDMHFDWSASQFLTKQFQVGLVGYVYKEIGCDSGSGDRVGCFQSQVVGVGPQLGFIFPVGDHARATSISKATRNLPRRTVPTAGIPGSHSRSRRRRPRRARRREGRCSRNSSAHTGIGIGPKNRRA